MSLQTKKKYIILDRSTDNSTVSHDNKSKNTHKTLYVKYMVSLRCKNVVRSELKKLGIPYRTSIHGAILIPESKAHVQYELRANLRKHGLVLLDERESELIDKIIAIVIETIHYSEELPKLNFSEMIREVVGEESKPILKIFSEVKGISIINFIVQQKLERAKELLLYDNLSVDSVTEKLNYKSKDLFIAQFKKYTGLTPSYFVKMRGAHKNLLIDSSSSRTTSSLY